VLNVYTKDEYPRKWAFTQNNLGGALCDLALRPTSTNRDHLSDRAEAAFRAALEVYSKDNEPVDWAGTQQFLGTALEAMADLGGDRQADRYRAALVAFDAVLEDVDPAQRAFNYDRCAAARARVAQKLAGLG
jgi:hypothetical protein